MNYGTLFLNSVRPARLTRCIFAVIKLSVIAEIENIGLSGSANKTDVEKQNKDGCYLKNLGTNQKRSVSVFAFSGNPFYPLYDV